MGYPKVIVSSQDGGLGFKADSKTGETLLVYVYRDEAIYPNGFREVVEYSDGLFARLAEREVDYIRDVEDFYAFEENRRTKIHFLAVVLDGAVETVLQRVFNVAASSRFTTLIAPYILDNSAIRLIGVQRRYPLVIPVGYTQSVDRDLMSSLESFGGIQGCLMDLFQKGVGVFAIFDNKTIGRGSVIASSIVDLRLISNSFFAGLCSCFITQEDGDDVGSQIVDMGAMLGKLASVPVHVNIGRVKDGALPLDRDDNSFAYPSGATVKVGGLPENILVLLHENRYNLYRKHIGKEGYYFTDGLTCAGATSDYKDIANVRVVNEASRIVYKTYLERLLDNVAVDSAGRLPSIVVKTIENELLRAIEDELGESISSARVTINPDQDIIGTGLLLVGLSIQPFGYAREIQVNVSLTKSL